MFTLFIVSEFLLILSFLTFGTIKIVEFFLLGSVFALISGIIVFSCGVIKLVIGINLAKNYIIADVKPNKSLIICDLILAIVEWFLIFFVLSALFV